MKKRCVLRTLLLLLVLMEGGNATAKQINVFIDNKTNDTIEKSDTLMGKADALTKKSDALIKKGDAFMSKRDALIKKSDALTLKEADSKYYDVLDNSVKIGPGKTKIGSMVCDFWGGTASLSFFIGLPHLKKYVELWVDMAKSSSGPDTIWWGVDDIGQEKRDDADIFQQNKNCSESSCRKYKITSTPLTDDVIESQSPEVTFTIEEE